MNLTKECKKLQEEYKLQQETLRNVEYIKLMRNLNIELRTEVV